MTIRLVVPNLYELDCDFKIAQADLSFLKIMKRSKSLTRLYESSTLNNYLTLDSDIPSICSCNRRKDPRFAKDSIEKTSRSKLIDIAIILVRD